MSDGYRTAFVFNYGIFSGKLMETNLGYAFEYCVDYLEDMSLPAISLTLPKQKEPFQSKTLFSFFDGLIPEGWLLDRVSYRWGIPIHDRFGLLLVACEDCVGSVQIRKKLI